MDHTPTDTNAAKSKPAASAGWRGMLPGFLREALWTSLGDPLKMSTATGFFRNEPQLSVVTALRPKPDRILVFACSDGCESYSIAMAYQRSDPATKPRIQGYDIEDRCVEHARRGVYERSQLDYYRNGQPAVAANQRFFEKVEGGACQVKTEIAALCEFNKGSILDGQFMAGLGRADVVFCQNVLVHLSDADKIAALENLCKVARPDGLLAIAGMQPEARERITLQLGLRPVTERCQEIHDGWLDLRELWDKSRPWQRPYYALEPFRKCRKWEYRYSTLFLLPTSSSAGV